MASRDRVDLLDGGRRPLLGLLAASTLDAAGVAADQLVVVGRLHDGLEEPVGLGDRRRARCLESLGTPGAHAGRRDLVQVHGPEYGQDVQPQEPAVKLLGGRGKAALVDPFQRVRLEVHGAHVGVDPVVALDVGLGKGQPGLRIGLRGEGLWGGAAAAVRCPVPRLPTPGGELAGGAELAPPLRLAARHQAAFR